MNFTNSRIKEFIDFIVSFDTINDILSKCKNQSERGLIFERIFDIIIKFGFCETFPSAAYDHLIGNVNTAKLKVMNNLDQYVRDKVFSGNSSGMADIILRDKKDQTYIFISSKYPKSRGNKTVEYYDVQNIIAAAVDNKEIYKKYKIYLAVPHKDTVIETFKNANKSSAYITRNITRDTILDKADLNRYFTHFKNAVKSISYIEYLGKTLTELFLFEKQNLSLRFHQELITRKTLDLILKKNMSFLWGCKCRSGKTYMTGGLILKLFNIRKKLNVLIITPAPTETISQFTDDLFHKFKDFDKFAVHHMRDSKSLENISLDDRPNIFISSKQLLQNYTGAGATIDLIKNLKFDLIFVDENHYSGTTELAKEIYQTYTNRDTIRVYLSATYHKPLLEWNISEECQMYWDIEDEQVCKEIYCAIQAARPCDNLYERLNSRHGKSNVENLLNFYKKEMATPAQIFACYSHMPDLHIITNMFDSERYEAIQERLTRGSKFGFCFETLFALNKSKTQFLFELEVKTVLRYISGSQKESDGDAMLFPRIRRLCANLNSRSPFTQIWFLPSNNINEISLCLESLMQEDNVLKNYDILCVNRKNKDLARDVKDEIIHAELIAISRGRSGVILLAGNMLTLGITLDLCDVVLLLNNSLSSDKVMQQMYRCMTEGKDKKIGIVVDLNISRVLNTCVNYSLAGMPFDTKIKYLIEYHLINIDIDMLLNKKINSDDIIKRLLLVWKTDPINAFRTLIGKLDDDCAIIDNETQTLINKTFAQSCSGDRLTLQVIMKDSPEDLQELPNGKEMEVIEAKKEMEVIEAKKEITISFSKDVLPYIIPLTCILTLRNDNMDFVKMLNYIKETPELLNVFDEQCLIWWRKKGLVDLVKIIINKFFAKDSNTFNVSLQFKSSLRSLIDKPKELLELINECLKPKVIEKRKHGEVFTPMSFINDCMLKDIEGYWLATYKENIWTNEKLTWCDPAAGMGNYPIAIYYKLMDGLKYKIPHEAERKKHIIERQIFMGELNKKNCFVIRQIFNLNNDVLLNLYCGDTLSVDLRDIFDIKAVKDNAENVGNQAKNRAAKNNTAKNNTAKFDIVIGNPPYNEELTRAGAKPLYNKFIMHYVDKCKLLSFIVPSRWFAGGKGLDKFRAAMLERTDIIYIKHFDDACKIFGNLVAIQGGVNYFLIDKNYNGLCEYKGKKVQFNKFDIILDAKYYDVVNKFLDKEKITKLYMGSYFDIKTNDKRLDKRLDDKLEDKRLDDKKDYIKCYVSQQKGFMQYIDRGSVKKDYNQYKVITARANSNSGCFGNMFIGLPNEVHTSSYISFKVASKMEAESLLSYLSCKLPNFMLSLRKISQDISHSTCKWIPLPPLDREWDEEKIYQYYSLMDAETAILRETKIIGYRGHENKASIKSKRIK